MNRPTQASPQLYARTIGALYLIVIVVGFFAYGYVPGKLIAADPVVTARNILAHEFLWRTGIVAALAVVVCAVPQLLFEYLLLRPVQHNVMLLAVLFNVISLVIESLSGLGYIAALSMAAGGALPAGRGLSMALDLHDADLNISFLFFGCVCLLYGYLIFRSRFLPRFLGVLMTIAGLCYSANSILIFLDLHVLPAAGVPVLLIPAGLSELILCLWLLIMGVDAAKWRLWSAPSEWVAGERGSKSAA